MIPSCVCVRKEITLRINLTSSLFIFINKKTSYDCYIKRKMKSKDKE